MNELSPDMKKVFPFIENTSYDTRNKKKIENEFESCNFWLLLVTQETPM